MIFVAVAVAWAVYLIPQAMRHHEEVARSRSIDRFSTTMRVLARREPISSRDARLVVTPGQAASEPVVTTKGRKPSTAQIRARREAVRRATRRRRRVLGVLLALNALTAILGLLHVIGWIWQALPGGLLVAWIVACRLMVKSERSAFAAHGVAAPVDSEPPAAEAGDVPEDYIVERNDQGFDEVAPEAETSTIPAVTDGDLWDPLPVTLPTYVSKPPAARRTVRTIDLGEPGAWTSGRTQESAEIAREADEVARAQRTAEGEKRRATGS